MSAARSCAAYAAIWSSAGTLAERASLVSLTSHPSRRALEEVGVADEPAVEEGRPGRPRRRMSSAAQRLDRRLVAAVSDARS